MLRNIGSTVSLVGSGRRSIVPATNGSQPVGGCNPLWTCGPAITCIPKTEPKVAIKIKENNQFQSKSVQSKVITSKSINIMKCRKYMYSRHILVCAYEMLLSPKENKVQASNNGNETCRTATQRPWTVKHEKRDKEKTTFTQRCQTTQSFKPMRLESKDKLYTDWIWNLL